MTTPSRAAIACLGAGRMGRGIAVAFAYAGHRVTLIDVKPRSAEQFTKLVGEALGEVRQTLASLARFGLLSEDDATAIVGRVAVSPVKDTAAALADAAMGHSCAHVMGGVSSLVTISLAVDFVGTAEVGQWLAVESDVVKTGKTICFAQSLIKADEIVIARANATFRVVPKKEQVG